MIVMKLYVAIWSPTGPPSKSTQNTAGSQTWTLCCATSCFFGKHHCVSLQIQKLSQETQAASPWTRSPRLLLLPLPCPWPLRKPTLMPSLVAMPLWRHWHARALSAAFQLSARRLHPSNGRCHCAWTIYHPPCSASLTSPSKTQVRIADRTQETGNQIAMLSYAVNILTK